MTVHPSVLFAIAKGTVSEPSCMLSFGGVTQLRLDDRHPHEIIHKLTRGNDHTNGCKGDAPSYNIIHKCVARLRLRPPHPTEVSTPVPMLFPRLGKSDDLHSGQYHCNPRTGEHFPGGVVCSAHTSNTPFSRQRTLQLRHCENTRDVFDDRLDAQRTCTIRLPCNL